MDNLQRLSDSNYIPTKVSEIYVVSLSFPYYLDVMHVLFAELEYQNTFSIINFYKMHIENNVTANSMV
jgi:hypothetical protein